MEGLYHVELLAHADELDGLARGRPDGERRAAPCVAVEFCKHDAGNAERLIKGGGRVHGVLTGHGVHHEKDLRRLDRIADVLQLLHERLVYMQAAGRVEKDKVVAVLLCMLHRGLGNVHGVRLPHLEHGDVELRADSLKLLYGGGPVNVTRGEKRALALPAHVPGELCPVRRFARALKADEHNDAWRLGADIELLILPAHELAQLFIDYFNDHLRRGKRFKHVRARGALRHGLCKVLDCLIADVRLKKGKANLAHNFLHVRRGQPPLAAQLFEGGIKFFTQAFKSHRSTS